MILFLKTYKEEVEKYLGTRGGNVPEQTMVISLVVMELLGGWIGECFYKLRRRTL